MFIGPQVTVVCSPLGVTRETGDASGTSARRRFLWFSARQHVRTPWSVSIKEQRCLGPTPSLISSLKGRHPLPKAPRTILMGIQHGEPLFWAPSFYRGGPRGSGRGSELSADTQPAD